MNQAQKAPVFSSLGKSSELARPQTYPAGMAPKPKRCLRGIDLNSRVQDRVTKFPTSQRGIGVSSGSQAPKRGKEVSQNAGRWEEGTQERL